MSDVQQILHQSSTDNYYKNAKSHISINLPTSLKLCLSYCQKSFALDPPTIADLLTKIGLVLSGNTTGTYR